ncbi:peptidylprolyl isomerase [Oceanicola sp. 22II-s10i]|uniref:peptidyl-prolyl cis-trans isomerase n=1 Tax=Oceanicola sp. 22II-s10i TaxID=1317116 RepID=UPI000B51F8A5|nr:SurA N-terminal domain-containing protein [Oceanicola sp. 22II-s10i]OWU83843.1 peptidylprolyl isomerase [Oceanicola sp. 22II-s10i]
MAAKKAGQAALWIVIALLIVGLGGFGVTNFSGQITSIGSVGGKDIDVDAYARALQEELRAIEAQTGQRLSFEDAEQMGLVEATLSQVITNRAFDAENERLGISVGDATLAEQLRQIPAFQGLDGNFDRDAYAAALDRIGMSDGKFEDRLREETARTILQSAVVSGIQMPAAYSATILNYVTEKRKVSWVKLDQDSLDAPLPEPTEEELRAFYDENLDRYMIPERKQITYALLSPEMVLDAVEIDEDTLRRAYEDRRAEFERPARRLVERLIFSDEATAQAARDRLDSGEVDFDTLVEERGLSLSDVDLGDVTEPELGSAGAEIFAAESGQVVGPLPSDLGPALFRINGIFPAQTTAHEDAIAIVRDDLVADRARRQVDSQREAIEDLLAGGATLEDLAQESGMQLGTIDWYEGLGEGVAAYDGFDTAAAALEDGAYPELQQLDDGSLVAMRLDGTLDAEPSPYEEEASRVRAGWENRETMARLRTRAETLRAQLQEAATFESLGLEPQTEELTRAGSALGAPRAMVEQLFTMQPGEVATTEGFGGVQLFRLDEILPPSEDDPQVAELTGGITDAASQSVGQDLFRAVASDIRTRLGVNIDQSALNAVHANFR